ncbi:MAG: hypothetical protein HC915_06205 [Anaerolineae bacterium]|nr:hypothetical protein [Anaerolineae bacterium]
MPILKASRMLGALGLLLSALPLASRAQEAPTAQPLPLPLEGFAVALLQPYSADLWEIEGQAGQRLHLSVERYPPDPNTQLDPWLEVLAPDGRLLASDEDSGPGPEALLLQLTLPQDGRYTLRVSNAQAPWNGGNYLLTVAEDALPPDCQSPYGTWVMGEWQSAVVRGSVPYRVFFAPLPRDQRPALSLHPADAWFGAERYSLG